MSAQQFRTGYMDNAVFELEEVLSHAASILTPHLDEFDTLVGTGFSGGLIVPALALRLGKSFVLVRKETDDSHHGSGRMLGLLGERWIFVDDFVSSGRTRTRVIDKVAEYIEQRRSDTLFYPNAEAWADTCRHVGDYYYGNHIEVKYQVVTA